MNIIKKINNAIRWVLGNQYLIINRWRFKKVGKRVSVIKPLRIEGLKSISLGDRVIVNKGSWLAALPLTGYNVQIVLKDGVALGHFNHIYATQSIVIEKDVLTADKVYISDNLHSYEDILLPVIKQPIKQCKPVVIGEGSWLGENVCVIGACVGKHCVIGANSVVTKDIPDYCVAVGAPARVIKKYSTTNNSWERVYE